MTKKIEENLKLLLKCCYRFGFIKGSELFIRFKLGYVHNIKVQGIKYPFSLRKKTSDIPTFYQLFLGKEYDVNFEKPQFIIDGGANIGLFAIIIKNKYPEATIVCVEPDAENFEILKQNVSLYSNIYCENCGIWDKDTKLKVYDKYGTGKWGMAVDEDLENGNIPAIAIKTIFDKYSIKKLDILKLDIETSEKQVFSNNFDGWLPRVKTILIELHDWKEEGCSKSFFEAINKSFNRYKFSTKGENVIVENINFK
jgi:FkbM family methyltransferase